MISNCWPSLLAADRAEPLALQPHVVGPLAHDRLDRVRARVGGEVDVGLGVDPIEEGVAHRPAHEVALVSGRAEPLGEVAGGRPRFEEARQARRRGHAPIVVGRLAAPRL